MNENNESSSSFSQSYESLSVDPTSSLATTTAPAISLSTLSTFQQHQMQNQQNNNDNNDNSRCDNCHRKQSQDLIQEAGNFYNINFSIANVTDIKKRRLFKLIHNLDHNNTD